MYSQKTANYKNVVKIFFAKKILISDMFFLYLVIEKKLVIIGLTVFCRKYVPFLGSDGHTNISPTLLHFTFEKK